jgi:hypothetical protein
MLNTISTLWKEITMYLYIQEKPLTTIRFTTVKYYSLMTYNLFNNLIISLPVLCYHIFLHLKVRNAWNIVYLLQAFQKFKRSRD